MAKDFVAPVEDRIDRSLQDQQDDIPRATLADLLSMDQTEMTPTWQAIFTAVEDLVTVRRG